MQKPPGSVSLLLAIKGSYFTKRFIFCHLLAVVVLLQTALLWGQSDKRIVDSPETSTVSANGTTPNIRVTKTGSVVVTGMSAINLGDFSGQLIIEKGNAVSTGLVQSDVAAITSAMTNPSSGDPAKIRVVKNDGTIKGAMGIDNSASQTKTTFVFCNLGTLTAGSNAYLGGAGIDKVFLYQGSTTIGNVILDAGNNTFFLDRGVTLDGSLTVGADDNSLTLLAGSTIVGDLTSGTGVNAIYLDTNPYLAETTITGDMDYSGNIWTSLIKKSGTNDFRASALYVSGDMKLTASHISIESLDGTGALAKDDKFLVLSAQSVSGALPTIGNVPPTEMLNFDVIGENANKDIYITVRNRELFADHVNLADKALAASVDSMIDSHAMASKNLDRVFGELQLGKKSDTRRFFHSSNPSQFLALPVSGIQTTRQMTFSIVDRMSVLRERLKYRNRQTPNYYYGQNCPINNGFGSGSMSCNARGRDVFIRGFGGYHKEDATSSRLGYRSTFQGIQIGFDHQVDSRSFLGLTAGYSDTSIKIKKTDNTADDLMLRFGGYYTRLLRNDLFFDAEVTYGHHSNELTRYYSIANVGGRSVTGKYQAHDLSSYVGLGRKFAGCDTFYITPLVSAQHIYYRQEAFSERGPYGIYHFDRQGLNSVNLRAALRIGQERWGGKDIGYEFEAGYNAELADDIRLKGAWIGGPSDMFTVSRSSASENGFYGAWKINVRPSDHCQLFGRYLGEGSKGGFSHGAEVGGLWRF